MSYTVQVQNFGKRLLFAHCDSENPNFCTVPHNYITGRLPPRYPVPAMIGEVIIISDEVIICDCDECFDPRLVIALFPDGKCYADYPHDSPNYR